MVERIGEMVTMGEALLLDVRGEAEFLQEHAAGAEHFDVVWLGTGRLPAVSKDMPIFVYCRSGGRAGLAKSFLERVGFMRVQNIGGLADWVARGGMLEK